MFPVQNIKYANVEITSRCNAACPFCPRNFNGYGVRDGFPIMDMTLDQFKTIFDQILSNENMVLDMCGTYGDPCVSPYFVEIVEYVNEKYPHVEIEVHTNGSLRSPDWWKNLASKNLKVTFGIDGLEDTHKIYRQQTFWNKIIENARAFNDAGGYATWQFIEFAHNRHQRNDCKILAEKYGFSEFKVFDDNRNEGAAYTPMGEPFWIGDNPEPLVPLDEYLKLEKQMQQNYEIDNQMILSTSVDYETIQCKSIDSKMIYVAANGDVWPCCWLGGSFPHTYDSDFGYELKDLKLNINGYKRSMVEIMNEFLKINNAWDSKSLTRCGHECGRCADGTGGVEQGMEIQCF